MATHSSVLAWRIPGTAERGGLPSMGSHRVGHDCSDLAAAAAGALFLGIFSISYWIFLHIRIFCTLNQILCSTILGRALCVLSVLTCSVMSDSQRPHGLQPTRLLCPWDSPGKNTRVGCYALFQGIFPTQGPNPGLPDCRQILYHLSHQGNLIKPKIIFISNELLVYLALYLLVYFVGVTIYDFLSQASCLFAEHSG